MKALFSLTILFLFSSLCHGYCFRMPRDELEETKKIECVDPADGRKHPIFSEWTNKKCMYCRCDDVMACCTRYGAIGRKIGCYAVLNMKKCQYELFRIDDPSKQCH